MERRKKFNCFFLEFFVIHGDLTFREKKKKIRVTGTLTLPGCQQNNNNN